MFLIATLLLAHSIVPAPREFTAVEGTLAVKDARIVEAREASIAREGYRLTVDAKGVTIVAADDAGAFYARETLKQLAQGGKYPCCTIADSPAYRWRGVMIDEARHFLGKAAVKKLLDRMAAYKLNVLHWHLTDDQGWRVEVKRHPELVACGAVRPRSVKYGCPTVWRKGGAKCEYDNDRYGPFYYTQDEIREIVAYAKALQIAVVPEIEVPGHVRALLAAHPEFACAAGTGCPPYRTGDACAVGRSPRDRRQEITSPGIDWGIDKEVLCVGNEDALKFVEDVFDEVCDLFPDAPYIHIGGDECPRTRWKDCAKCQARMKAENLKAETDLQSYVTDRIVRHLAARGRKAIGWDEVLSGDVPKTTAGMSWRVGQKEGAGTSFVSAKEALTRGHDLVMTPNDTTYLSRPQGFRNDPYPYFSPRGPQITLKKAYAFDPMKGLPKEARAHILGGQASVWGEYIWNANDLEWKTWPRACAVAEALWTDPKKRDYADFRRRMEAQRGAMAKAGINCAPLDADDPFMCPYGDLIDIPLANAGFEHGRSGGWNFGRNHSVVWREDGAGYCAEVEIVDPDRDSIYLTRSVPIKPGHYYMAKCEIRTENVTRKEMKNRSSVGACLIVEWTDANRKWCGSGQYSKSLWGTTGWTKSVCDSLRAPTNAAHATIYLALRGKGRAWFDNVTFAETRHATDKLTPAAEFTVPCNTPKFSWRKIAKARTYRLLLSQDPAFAQGVRNYDAGGFTEYQLTEPLAAGTWYWRVDVPGCVDARPYRFCQTVPADRDCLAPIVKARAMRVTDAHAAFSVKVFENGCEAPKVTFLGVDGMCRDRDSQGVWTCEFAAPAKGWPKGFTETRLVAKDASGNSAESDFYFLNAPAPANGNRIDEKGRFVENGQVVFPLGIYQVEPKYMKEVRACGFDVVHSYKWESGQDEKACREYLDRCWAADGLRAFIGFDRGNESKNGIVQGNLACVARRVGALADHPALYLWYLFDEPEIDFQFVTPDQLAAFADLVRALDPYHTVVMTTWGKTMNEYRRTWDTHWTQAYGNPSQVVSLLEEHRALLKHDSPITLLVNCNDSEQGKLFRETGKMPDASKFNRDYDFFKACAFMGIVKECNGVFWWWFARDDKNFFSASKIPAVWAQLVRVVKELGAMRPLIAADGAFTSGTVRVGNDRVEWRVKTVNGKRTLIAINTADHPVTATLDLSFATFTRTFGRYETVVGEL